MVDQITGERILCVTLSDWDDAKRTRHHLMNILAEENEVVWVEKSVSIAAFDHTSGARYFKFLEPVTQVKPGLRLLTPPPALPLLDKLAITDQINGCLFLSWLKTGLQKLDFKPTILWLCNSFAHRLVGEFGEQISLFHCNDACYNPRVMREERKLLKKVDLVLTVSEQLKKERDLYNSNCHLVLHGVELDNFADPNPPVPGDLHDIPRPIIGYVGIVSWGIDLDLLKYVASQHPDWSVVIVGPLSLDECSKEARKEWQNVQLPNFHLLGAKPRSELAGYYHGVDVALYPYILNDQTVNTQVASKFFEYLAMGRPVVSTNFATYKGIPSEFYKMASNKEEFVLKIKQCLREDSPARQAQRREYAEKNSLRQRLKSIAKLIQETKEQKRSD